MATAAGLWSATVAQEPIAPGSVQQTEAAVPSADAAARERALDKTRQLLERRPTHPALFDRYFKLVIQANRLDEELATLAARSEKNPNDEGTAVVRGRLLLRAGQDDSALDVLTAIDSPSPEVEGVLGDIYFKLARFDLARRSFQSAVAAARTTEDKARLFEKIGRCDLALGDKAAALAVWRKIGELDGGKFHRRLAVAELCAEAGLLDEAGNAYQPLLAETAEDPERHCRVLRDFGRLQELQGQLDAALATYEQVLERTSRGNWLRKEVERRTVQIYRRTGRLDELVTQLEAAVVAAPDELPKAELLADVLTETRDLVRATEVLADARNRYPKDLRLARRLADLYLDSEQIDSAIQEYQRILLEHPDESELYLELGTLFARNQRLAEAKHQWSKVERSLDDATLCARIASMYALWEQPDDSIRLYEKAIELEPDSMVRYGDLTGFLFRLNRGDDARAVLERAADVATGQPRRLEALAADFREYRLPERAQQCFEEVLALEPDNHEVRYGLAELLLTASEPERATTLLWQVVDGSQDSVHGYRTMAANTLVSIAARGKTLDALKANAEQRDSAGAAFVLGRVHTQGRDFETAIVWFRKAIERRPEDLESRRVLARLLADQNDLTGALELYEQLAVVAPGERRRNFRDVARLHLERFDLDAAIQVFEDAMRRNPDDATVFVDVGRELLDLQRTTEAVGAFRQAARLKPDSPDVMFRLASSLRRAGKLDEAERTYLDLAISNDDPDDGELARKGLFELYAEQGRIDERIAELVEAIAENRYDIEAPELLADLYLRTGDYVLGLETIDRALRYQPRERHLMVRRTELLEALEDWEAARLAHEELLKFPNADRDLHLAGIGVAMFELGRAEAAESTFAKIQDRGRVAKLFNRFKLHNAAIEYFQATVARDPRDLRSYVNLGNQLEKANRRDEAIAAFERVLDQRPFYRSALQPLGKLYIQADRRDDAISVGKRLFGIRAETESKTRRQEQADAEQQNSRRNRGAGFFYSPFGGNRGAQRLQQAQAYFTERGLTNEWGDILVAEARRRPTDLTLYQAVKALYSWRDKSATKLAAFIEDLLLRDPATLRIPPGHTRRSFLQMVETDLVAVWQQDLKVAEARLAELDKELETANREVERAVVFGALGKIDEQRAALRSALDLEPDHSLALHRLAARLREDKDFTGAIANYRRLLEWWDSHEVAATARRELEARDRTRFATERRTILQNLPRSVRRRTTDADLLAMRARTAVVAGSNLGASYSYGGSTPQSFSYPEAVPQPLAILTALIALHRAGGDETGLREVVDLATARADNLGRRASIGKTLVAEKQYEAAEPVLLEALDEARTLRSDPAQLYFWDRYSAPGVSAATGLAQILEARGETLAAYELLTDFGVREEATRVAKTHDLATAIEQRLAEGVAEQQASLEKARSNASDDARTIELDYRDAIIRLADHRFDQNQFDDAEAAYDSARVLLPDDLAIRGVLAQLRLRREDPAGAIAMHNECITIKRRLKRAAGGERSAPPTRLRPTMPSVSSDGNRYMTMSGMRFSSNRQGFGFGLNVDTDYAAVIRIQAERNNKTGVLETLERVLREDPTVFRSIADQVVSVLENQDLGDEKLRIFRVLRTAVTGNVWLAREYADACAEMGEDREAERAYTKIVEDPTSEAWNRSHAERQLVKLRKKRGASEASLTELRAAIESDPDNVRKRMELVELLMNDKEFQEAFGHATAIVQKAPYLDRAKDCVVQCGSVIGNDEAVEAMLRRLVDEAKEAQPKLRRSVTLADWLWASDRRDEACAIIDKLDVETGGNSQFSPGNWFLDHHLEDQAIVKLEAEVEKLRTQPWLAQRVRGRTARVELAVGREAQAIGRYLDAIDEAGSLGDREARFKDLLSVVRGHPDPELLYQKLDAQHGKRESIRDRLAMLAAEFARGEIEAGERELEAAIEASSKEVYLYPMLLGMRRLQGDFQGALDVLDAMSKVYGGSDATQWSSGISVSQRVRLDLERARILRQMGREDDALAKIRAAVDETTTSGLSTLTQIYTWLEMHEEALATHHRYVERLGKATVDTHFAEAAILETLERYPEALVAIQAADAITSEPATTRDKLIELHRRLGSLPDYVTTLEERFSADERDKTLRSLLAELYAELQATDKLAGLERRMLEDPSTRDETLSQLYSRAVKDDDSEAAIGYLERLIELSGGSQRRDYLSQLSRRQTDLGDLDLAEANLRESLDLEVVADLKKLASWLDQNRDHNASRPVWEQIREQQSNDLLALSWFANRAYDAADWPTAVDLFVGYIVESQGGISNVRSATRNRLVDALFALPAADRDARLQPGDSAETIESALVLRAISGDRAGAADLAKQLLERPESDSVIAYDVLHMLAKQGDDPRAEIAAAEDFRSRSERLAAESTTYSVARHRASSLLQSQAKLWLYLDDSEAAEHAWLTPPVRSFKSDVNTSRWRSDWNVVFKYQKYREVGRPAAALEALSREFLQRESPPWDDYFGLLIETEQFDRCIATCWRQIRDPLRGYATDAQSFYMDDSPLGPVRTPAVNALVRAHDKLGTLDQLEVEIEEFAANPMFNANPTQVELADELLRSLQQTRGDHAAIASAGSTWLAEREATGKRVVFEQYRRLAAEWVAAEDWAKALDTMRQLLDFERPGLDRMNPRWQKVSDHTMQIGSLLQQSGSATNPFALQLGSAGGSTSWHSSSSAPSSSVIRQTRPEAIRILLALPEHRAAALIAEAAYVGESENSRSRRAIELIGIYREAKLYDDAIRLSRAQLDDQADSPPESDELAIREHRSLQLMLADSLEASGDEPAALGVRQDVRAALEHTLRDGAPKPMLSDLASLAALLIKMNEHRAALTAHERLRSLALDPMASAAIRAKLHSKLGEHDRAIELYELAMDRQRRSSGNPESSARTAARFGIALVAAGRIDGARPYLERAADTYDEQSKLGKEVRTALESIGR